MEAEDLEKTAAPCPHPRVIRQRIATIRFANVIAISASPALTRRHAAACRNACRVSAALPEGVTREAEPAEGVPAKRYPPKAHPRSEPAEGAPAKRTRRWRTREAVPAEGGARSRARLRAEGAALTVSPSPIDTESRHVSFCNSSRISAAPLPSVSVLYYRHPHDCCQGAGTLL